jgi:hypothetical protein
MHHAKTLRIGDLLGSKVVTAEGKTLDHMVDIEITHSPEQEVTALVYGTHGWLYRWHVLYPFAQKFGLSVESYKVPWNAVESFEDFTVKLKPGWEPKSQ